MTRDELTEKIRALINDLKGTPYVLVCLIGEENKDDVRVMQPRLAGGDLAVARLLRSTADAMAPEGDFIDDILGEDPSDEDTGSN